MRIHEALASHSKDEKSMDYERRHGRSWITRLMWILKIFIAGCT